MASTDVLAEQGQETDAAVVTGGLAAEGPAQPALFAVADNDIVINDLDGILFEPRRDDHLGEEPAGAERLSEPPVRFHDRLGKLDVHVAI